MKFSKAGRDASLAKKNILFDKFVFFSFPKDYLRVFTWDKKVETYIKTIGGQGKMPTIVSPEIYRTRFINAIDRYFLEVPDQWYTQDVSRNDSSPSTNK